MPYDPSKTTSLIQTAALHTRMPNADFIAELTQQIKAAESFAEESASTIRNANTSLSVAKHDLNAETVAHFNTRQLLNIYKGVLEQIAAGAKNPKKLAAETLNPTPEKPKKNAEQTASTD